MNRWGQRLAGLIEGSLTCGLIYFLLVYGLGKVVSRQFFIRLPWLDEPAGHLDGFQLAWTFHAHSRRYEIGLGLVETFCGALLVLPRLRVFGALATAAVMANIVFLNIEYDIGALIPSAPMLAAAVTVLALRGGQLWRLLMERGRPPAPAEPLWPRWAVVVGWGILAFVVGGTLYQVWVQRQFVATVFAPSELHGRYRVTEVGPNGKSVRPIEANTIVYFDLAGSAGLRVGPRLKLGRYRLDPSTKELELTLYDVGFEYFHEQHRTGDARERLFVPANVILTAKGRYRWETGGELVVEFDQPSGVIVRLRREDKGHQE